MNFLGFRPNAFIISKKNHLPLFELIKDESYPEGTVLENRIFMEHNGKKKFKI
jgi:hypothetical protein